MASLALLDSNIVTVQFSEDSGANWVEIPGITNYSVTRNAAAQRDVTAFKNRTRSLAGASGSRTVTLEGIRPPLDPTWNRLEALSDQRTIVPQFRILGSEREVTGVTSGGNTVAITQAGVVTFAGTPDKGDPDIWAPGMSFKVGASFAVIKSISDAGVVVTGTISADIAAGVYSVVEGAAQRTIRGDIINAGNDSLSDGAELTDTITVNVQSINAWTAVA